MTDYRLRIVPLEAGERLQPPDSTLRAIEAYIGACMTAAGIHGAVLIEPMPEPPAPAEMWECPTCFVRLPLAEGPYRCCPAEHPIEEED